MTFWRNGMLLWFRSKRLRADSALLRIQGMGARMARSKAVTENEAALMAASDETWRSLAASDWMEAFRSHPRIGESGAAMLRASTSLRFIVGLGNAGAKRTLRTLTMPVKIALAEANREYEKKFGRIFIVCATGKSARGDSCRFFSDACKMMRTPNFTKQPNSSGRSRRSG